MVSGGNMSDKPRCKRCFHELSPKRKTEKYCFKCAKSIKQEQEDAAHDRYVCKRYGLYPGEYTKMYEAQDGHCAIKNCRATGASKRLSVEHNHKFELGDRRGIRGLTCNPHNEQIGVNGDDPEVFRSIAEYLENPPAQKVLDT